MSVAVVTDSAATIPPGTADELGVAVVPIRVMIGDRSYPDGAIGLRDLLESDEPVTTSGPAVADFLSVFEEQGTDDGIVVLTLSHDMGASTFLAARAAAGSATIPVRVIDTATAARVARAGGTLEEVEQEARRVAGRVRLVAMLRDLEYLSRSGHVPEAAAWASRWIGLHPVVELRNGRVRPMRPALGERSALDRVLDAWRSDRPAGRADLHVAALHAFDEDGARSLLGRVADEIDPVEAFVGSFGTGMVVHSGPGVLGLAWWWEERTGA